jgi:hypothetical protein
MVTFAPRQRIDNGVFSLLEEHRFGRDWTHHEAAKMAFTTSIGTQHSNKVWTVHVGWKIFSEIVRVRIQPVHKIRAGTYTGATNAYNEHYISKSYLAKHYRASNGSSGELRPAKMEPTICGF